MLNIVNKLFILLMAGLFISCSSAQVNNKPGPSERASVATSGASPDMNKRIDGDWEGLMIRGASLVYIKMELSPNQADGNAMAYRGKAYAQPFKNYLNGYEVKSDIHASDANITVAYHPEIKTFAIKSKPGTRSGRVFVSSYFRDLGGVHDWKQDALAGLRLSRFGTRKNVPNTGNDFFFFLRPDQFRMSVKTFERLVPSRRRRKLSLNRPFSRVFWFGGPSREKMRQWAEPLYAASPNLDLYNVPHGQLELIAIKLFRDTHFKSHFSKSFDDLGVGDLGRIRGSLIQLKQKSRHLRDRSTGALDRMFWVGRGDCAAAQTALWVKAQRHLMNWHQSRFDALGRLPENKQALEYTDLLQAEVEKIAATLLWAAELEADQKLLAAARKQIALPTLGKMLAKFETEQPSFELMRRIASWQSDESRLFGYLDPSHSQQLTNTAKDKLNQIIAALLPPYERKIDGLGRGLAAIENGSAWYREMTQNFAPVLEYRQVQATLRRFKKVRSLHLDQTATEMCSRLQQEYEKLPTDMSKSAGQPRLRYLSSLKKQLNTWFSVPGDGKSQTAIKVRKTAGRLGGLTAGLLPPRLASSSGFNPMWSSESYRPHLSFYRSRVDQSIAATGTLVYNDAMVRHTVPKPIQDPGFRFKSNTVWALFHGRFDELDPRLYRDGLGSRVVSNYLNTNPRFHYAFITLIGLSSLESGSKLAGPSMKVGWKQTRDGEVVRDWYGQVWMPKFFFSFYEHSYKLAVKTSSTDALLGKNGLRFLEALINFRDKGLMPRSRVRADGEFQFASAEWEQAILDDLKTLLEKWPSKSYGIWQLQENIARVLKQRPSMQSLYQAA